MTNHRDGFGLAYCKLRSGGTPHVGKTQATYLLLEKLGMQLHRGVAEPDSMLVPTHTSQANSQSHSPVKQPAYSWCACVSTWLCGYVSAWLREHLDALGSGRRMIALQRSSKPRIHMREIIPTTSTLASSRTAANAQPGEQPLTALSASVGGAPLAVLGGPDSLTTHANARAEVSRRVRPASG